MKRDPDLIRAIAFATEALGPSETLDHIAGVKPATFAAHVQWMRDAGLVDARVLGLSNELAIVVRLTWAGCDFLDAARSEPLWQKAKSSVIAPTASWTFDILRDWLKAEIQQGLPTFRGLSS